MRFRSKPVEIDAEHITIDRTPEELARWCGGNVVPHPDQPYTGGALVIEIPTLEGTMRAGLGDWIIKGTEGEFYPCKDSVFRRKYEAVDE